MSEPTQYTVPTSGLGLKGPMVRPEPGTVPLRGDLAHIALADRYLVPHYVVPQIFVVGTHPAELKLNADPNSKTLVTLPADSVFEVLDLAGDWYWGCVSLEGPSGYVPLGAIHPREG